MSMTDSTAISNRTLVYAEKMMLKHAAPVVVLDRFGVQKRMPRNKTTQIKFRRPKVFSAQTTPLAEGVTPKPTVFQYEDVPGTLRQYGQTATVTDVIQDTHEDPVLNDLVKQLGENVGRTTEALNWGVLRAGTNVFYANGSSRSAVNTTLSIQKQRAVTRALKRQKAMKVREALSSSPDFKTSPIEACFVAVAHTDLENDIREMPNFVPCVEYGTKSQISEHEIGAVEDCRYILSPDLDAFLAAGGTPTGVVSDDASSADVYPILYFGQEAYANVALRGQGAVSPTIIPVNQKTKDDPLGQRGVAGWKMWHLCLILNQLWMARLEVAATEL